MVNFKHTILFHELQNTVFVFPIEKLCLCGTEVLIPTAENLFISYHILTHSCFK